MRVVYSAGLGTMIFIFAFALLAPAEADWLRGARIATPWDYPEGTLSSWTEAVDRAVADGATVILDWTRISDDWRCLYEPCLSEDLAEVARRAGYVHTRYPGVRYLIYVAPLEYVTPDLDQDGDGRVDPGKAGASLAIQHPDWLQIGISGRRAVFYGTQPGMPFWVCPSCEDAWVTPAHPGFRKLVLRQARELAQAGVDGIWLDVPFLRHSFGEVWRNEWPDVSPYARELFREQTGWELPPPPFSSDWEDPAWLAFVGWRYRLIREFLGAYRRTVKGINSDVELIVESSTGFNAHTTQTAADPVELALLADTVAHEWGPVRRPAQYYTWLWFVAGLLPWRHVDLGAGRPSWLLSYVEAGHTWTDELARLHAAAVALTGFSYYTSGNESMSGMPDSNFRRDLFRWLAEHRDLLYSAELEPLAEVAVVFSRNTLDFRGRGSWEEGAYSDGFYGMLMLLLESHIPFQVITERELQRLAEFKAVITPGWEAMSGEAAEALREYVAGGGVLLATGETSLYDGWGRRRDDFALAELFGIHAPEVDPEDEAVHVREFGRGRVVYSSASYERWYFWAAEPWDPQGGNPREAEAQRRAFLKVWEKTGVHPAMPVDVPRGVVVIPWRARDAVQIHLLNLSGVAPARARPHPQRVRVRAGFSEAVWTEFLGDPRGLDPIDEPRFTVICGGVLELKRWAR